MKRYRTKFYNIMTKFHNCRFKLSDTIINEKNFENSKELLKIRNIQDFIDNIPESVHNISDTTEETRNYAYGQGSSKFVKYAEKVLIDTKEKKN
jgi:hypothetical protein